MKKFISWVSIITLFVSIISCRETEELLTISEEIQNNAVVEKIQKDSVDLKINSLPSNESVSLEVEIISDPPPKKDEIKW